MGKSSSLNGARGCLLRLGENQPKIADDVFVAPGAILIGDVDISAGASIWFNCVLRGDVASICLGRNSNIQDGSVVHADPGMPVYIGANVLIGHVAIIHGCTIRDGAFVGMGSIVLSGAVIHEEGMLAAGAMLTGGKSVGPRELWAGRPARYVRRLHDDELVDMKKGVEHYRWNARHYLDTLQQTV